jgi:alpha/beta superfamily hydrolase
VFEIVPVRIPSDRSLGDRGHACIRANYHTIAASEPLLDGGVGGETLGR